MQTSINVPKVKTKYTDYLNNPSMNSIFLEQVEPEYVIEVINKLKPKLNCGYDNISTKLLKETIHLIIKPITHIINTSLDTGIVPDRLKIAKVITIYKNSDKSILENYRPVSLLSAFSKIFEKIMYNKLVSFLNHNETFYKHQYGFREKHSTIHPILHLINHCADVNNRKPKEYTLAIFL